MAGVAGEAIRQRSRKIIAKKTASTIRVAVLFIRETQNIDAREI
jgi:hypothetical protein